MAMEATISSTASARPGLPSVIVAATIGNVLEWFDFLVYGFFAVTIAEVVLSGRQPDGLAADHLRHLRACLPGAAARGDHRRHLQRSRRPQGGAHPLDWADADRYDADGGHAGLRDDRARRADHHHRRAPAARLEVQPTLRAISTATESTMTRRRAACTCGQLHLSIEGEPSQISMCHCLECQRRTGAVISNQARFRREQVTFAGKATAWMRTAERTR